MSDIEHELVVDNVELRDEVARLATVALRALESAIAAQDTALGRHDAWLDEARDALVSQAPSRTQ